MNSAFWRGFSASFTTDLTKSGTLQVPAVKSVIQQKGPTAQGSLVFAPCAVGGHAPAGRAHALGSTGAVSLGLVKDAYLNAALSEPFSSVASNERKKKVCLVLAGAGSSPGTGSYEGACGVLLGLCPFSNEFIYLVRGMNNKCISVVRIGISGDSPDSWNEAHFHRINFLTCHIWICVVEFN